MTISRPTKISRVGAGDALSARHYNQLVDGINLLMDMVGNQLTSYVPAIRHVELDEDVPQYERGKTGNRIGYDGTVLPGDDPIVDLGSDSPFVAEIQNSIHLAGERLPLFWDRPSGKHFVLPVLNWHIAKLDEDLEPGGSALATIWQLGASAEEASALSVTVYDWSAACARLLSGTPVVIFHHRQSRRWYVMSQVLYKPKCRFTLDEEMTTAMASAEATLTDQWGQGLDHSITDITVENQESDSAGLYVFEGNSGAAGWASFKSHTASTAIWVIDNMQCRT